jgi:hypothetical protein
VNYAIQGHDAIECSSVADLLTTYKKLSVELKTPMQIGVICSHLGRIRESVTIEDRWDSTIRVFLMVRLWGSTVRTHKYLEGAYS